MAEQATKQPRQEGIVAKTFGLLTKLAFWLLISLVFSIAVEWVGMTFWWPDEGAAHSQQMLTQELDYLNEDFKRSIVTSDPADYALRFVAFSNEWLFERTGFSKTLAKLRRPPARDENKVMAGLRRGYVQVIDYVEALINTVETFSVRLAVLTLAMPAFALAGLVAMTDGLVRRDLRRWGGGRETSFVYHHAKRVVLPTLAVAWVVYLSLPISIHPTFVVLPFAVLFALAVAVTSSTFKKYL